MTVPRHHSVAVVAVLLAVAPFVPTGRATGSVSKDPGDLITTTVVTTTTVLPDDLLTLFPESDPAQDGFVAGTDGDLPATGFPAFGMGGLALLLLVAGAAAFTRNSRSPRRRPPRNDARGGPST